MSLRVEFRQEEPNGTIAVIVTRKDGALRMVPADWRGIAWQSTVDTGQEAWARLPPDVLDAIGRACVAHGYPQAGQRERSHATEVASALAGAMRSGLYTADEMRRWVEDVIGGHEKFGKAIADDAAEARARSIRRTWDDGEAAA